jgi:hypothetical protein
MALKKEIKRKFRGLPAVDAIKRAIINAIYGE